MTLFLLSFFLIYGLMQGYVFLKARAAFPFGPAVGIPLALFVLFMMLAPVATRILEKQGAGADAALDPPERSPELQPGRKHSSCPG